MAEEAIDFKKVTSKKYRLWRILHSNPIWATIYRERDAQLNQFRSAVIFPEQLLGLNQNRIWSVISLASDGEVTIKIKALYDFKLYIDRIPVVTSEQIFEFEQGMKQLNDKRLLAMSSNGSLDFTLMNLFTNLDDAVKFGEKEQMKLLSKYC